MDLCLFPASLTGAEVTPIQKTNDILLKENCVLLALSKVFECVFIDQLSDYFNQHLAPYISGFRKGYDRQSVLIRFTEPVKRRLDNGEAAGALLTDLSKAFDYLHMTC